VRTYRDAEKGAAHGRNTAYTLSMDNVQVCYLGHIGHTPTSDPASALGDVDVLLVAVGDEGLDIAAVAETVGVLEPRLIVPIGAPTESDVVCSRDPRISEVGSPKSCVRARIGSPDSSRSRSAPTSASPSISSILSREALAFRIRCSAASRMARNTTSICSMPFRGNAAMSVPAMSRSDCNI